jgi:hypothetical protein
VWEREGAWGRRECAKEERGCAIDRSGVECTWENRHAWACVRGSAYGREEDAHVEKRVWEKKKGNMHALEREGWGPKREK